MVKISQIRLQQQVEWNIYDFLIIYKATRMVTHTWQGRWLRIHRCIKIALWWWRFSRTMNPSAEIPIRHVLIVKDMHFLVDAPSHERNYTSMVHPVDGKHFPMTCWQIEENDQVIRASTTFSYVTPIFQKPYQVINTECYNFIICAIDEGIHKCPRLHASDDRSLNFTINFRHYWHVSKSLNVTMKSGLNIPTPLISIDTLPSSSELKWD